MAINNWWDADPREVYWMEIRKDAIGLGEYLRAPKAAADGRPSWSYELTSYVQPGDRVFHWNETGDGEPAIVGWSQAVGPLETINWSWQARGTRGRERGVPTTGPTWNMPLEGYTELEVPVTRSSLNARRNEILAVLAQVAGGSKRSIYAPFQNYGDRELRAQQGYLAKFPLALLSLIFEAVVGNELEAKQGARSSAHVTRGQGYLTDAEKRAALERHAVQIAIQHYRDAGATQIVELGKPYDLRVTLGGIERHVEVKGSMGEELGSVQLTQGEVDHARSFQPTDLFVVDGIRASRGQDGQIATSGGVVRLWSEWTPRDRDLRATHLRYSLPSL